MSASANRHYMRYQRALARTTLTRMAERQRSTADEAAIRKRAADARAAINPTP
jgi:hypothetical protein